MANLFPSLKPKMSNKLWFSKDDNIIIESDIELTKQELEYSLKMKEEVTKGNTIVPIGKEKEKSEENGKNMD